MEEIKSRPEIDIEWRPIESHPLPENHPPHTYLAGQCYYTPGNSLHLRNNYLPRPSTLYPINPTAFHILPDTVKP